MVKTTNDERQPEEAKQVANDIIRKFKRMKLKGFSTSHYVFEVYSYECLGNLCQVKAAKTEVRFWSALHYVSIRVNPSPFLT